MYMCENKREGSVLSLTRLFLEFLFLLLLFHFIFFAIQYSVLVCFP
jgi:hypothetical protein